MTVTKIETLGDLRRLIEGLSDVPPVSSLVIERHRPKMVRRGAAYANIIVGEQRQDGTYVVLALRPHEAMPDFHLSIEEHGMVDLGGEGG